MLIFVTCNYTILIFIDMIPSWKDNGLRNILLFYDLAYMSGLVCCKLQHPAHARRQHCNLHMCNYMQQITFQLYICICFFLTLISQGIHFFHIMQVVCYLTVLNLHASVIWPLRSKLEICSSNCEYVWYCFGYSNRESNHTSHMISNVHVSHVFMRMKIFRPLKKVLNVTLPAESCEFLFFFSSVSRPLILYLMDIFLVMSWFLLYSFNCFKINKIIIISCLNSDMTSGFHHFCYVELVWSNIFVFQVHCEVRGSLEPPCNAVGLIDRTILGEQHLYQRPVYRRTKVTFLDCSDVCFLWCITNRIPFFCIILLNFRRILNPFVFLGMQC